MNPGQPPGPYQHWLDDAANMGLMLFRMRNDSKREGIVARQQSSGTPPGTPPPVVLSPQGHRVGTTPPEPFSPSGRHGTPPIPIPGIPSPPPPPHGRPPISPSNPQNVTPRTGLALQTPTVATTSSATSGNSRAGTESTVSSTHDQAPDIPSTFYREPRHRHHHSSHRSQHLD